MMDGYLSQLDAMGCTIVVTADHGMNAKHDENGQPDVIYLQTLLDDWLGEGNTRVILPITDPYVVHHGALGSYATVYLGNNIDQNALIEKLAGYDGVLMALDRKAGCEKFELPEDRVGDIIIISEQNKALGTSADRHDLSALKEPLRSHGGVTEQKVPLLMNCRSDISEDRKLRNFDIYDVALNHSI
jgi:phosphonoacetate hydrolase